MSEPDSIPARMAELNKTLEHLNTLFRQCGSLTAGDVAAKAREVAAHICRLSTLPIPEPKPITIRVPESALRPPPSALP